MSWYITQIFVSSCSGIHMHIHMHAWKYTHKCRRVFVDLNMHMYILQQETSKFLWAFEKLNLMSDKLKSTADEIRVLRYAFPGLACTQSMYATASTSPSSPTSSSASPAKPGLTDIILHSQTAGRKLKKTGMCIHLRINLSHVLKHSYKQT